jgi:hypothetical protein
MLPEVRSDQAVMDDQFPRIEGSLQIHDLGTGDAGGRAHYEGPASACLFAFVARIGKILSLCAMSLAGWGAERGRAEVSELERGIYARAVEYCRGTVERPMALDLDKHVLCFDGQIFPELDISIATRLEYGGLAVVRSFGGDQLSAITLAEAFRERHATVVVYDYCLSACASFLLVASTKTFVLRNTLVAWHHPTGAYLCPSLAQAKDGGPRRLEKNTCSDAPADYQSVYEYAKELDKWFYEPRAVAPPFENPPQSVIVRRILQNKFAERGEYPPNLLWTWNPRYYAGKIKTKIIYEAYPQSQDEVDALARWFQVRVIYDP